MADKTDEILAAWAEFFLAHGLAIREIERQLLEQQAPLSLAEYDVLLVISRSPDQRSRLSALADATVFTRSGITRIVNRLEEQGLLKKETCPADKRGAFAVITRAGQQAMKTTWKHYGAAIVNLMAGNYSTEEAQQLRNLLSKMTSSLLPESVVQIKKKPLH